MNAMPSAFNPYPAYHPSGIPWLGAVPEHWEVRKLRSILAETTERDRPNWPLLSVVRERGVILRDVTNKDENHNYVPDDLTNYKVVHKGQFAMNKMKAWQGSYGVSMYDGIVSPAYYVFDIGEVTGDYFHLAIRSKAYVPFFGQASDGVRIGQWDLSKARMQEIPFPLPPPGEQRAIVRYLDHVDRRVRRYVAAKRKLIGLLEEEKQAMVNRAVTRGLDPNVRLKPSGVEWLGDVPEHWDTMRARFLFKEIDTRSTSGRETHPSMSQTLGLVSSHLVEQSLISDSYVGGKLCRIGDLVLNRLKAHLGVFALAKQAGVISPDYSVFRKRDSANMEYFFMVFRVPALRTELRIRAKGIVEGFWSLYTDDFFDIRLPIPPSIEQQTLASSDLPPLNNQPLHPQTSLH